MSRGRLSDVTVKYHEEIHRHPARTAEGKPCEILERVTFERSVLADGSPSEVREVNRRFDLKTGERVNHLGGDDYELDLTGERLQILREA
jgi:hypothetical protein